jgi:hypothetical protein
MKWYLAKLICRIVCGDDLHTAQFDEQLRLIYAEDDLHAFNKARLVGEKEQDQFLNNYDKPVLWKFIDVAELHCLDNLLDGAELYSTICEQENAEAYIRNTQLRATLLFENTVYKSIALN